MTSSERNFHLTLPSNASMDVYPNNTAAMCVTKLPKPIELHVDWVVSLQEILKTLASDNTPHGYCSFDVKSSNGNVRYMEFLRGGMYEVIEEVLDELNILGAEFNITFHLAVRRDRKVKITVGETHEFRPNDRLTEILGLSSYRQWYTSGEHLAQMQMKLLPRMQVTTLYVYCNIPRIRDHR